MDKIGLRDFDRYNGNPRDFALWKARFEGALDELDLFEVATGIRVLEYHFFIGNIVHVYN